MICRRDDCLKDIPRPTPRSAPNGYCSYECEHIVKTKERQEKHKNLKVKE